MFNVFKKEWRAFLRDKSSFFTYLFVPLMLIGVLGIALSGAFSEEGPTIQPVKLSVSNEDKGDFGDQFVDVLKGDSLSDVFTVVRKDADIHLRIPKNYSDRLIKQIKNDGKADHDKLLQLTIKTDSPDAIGVSVLRQAADQFSTTVIGQSLQGGDVPVNGSTYDAEIPVQTLSPKKEMPSAFQYYAIAMGVMYLLFMGMGGTKAMVEEMDRHTLMRLSMTPHPLWQLMAGKFLGWTVLGICQFVILMVGTHYIFGVDWGTSYVALGILLLAYVWTVTSLGMLLASMIRNEKTADRVGTLLVMILAAAGGSMLPIYNFPDFMNHITSIIPNSWALRGFLDILHGGNLQAVGENIAILVGMGLLFFVTAAWRLRTRIGV